MQGNKDYDLNKVLGYLCLFLLLCPIFMSLDFSEGLTLNVVYGVKRMKLPSLPASLIFLGLIGLCNIRCIISNAYAFGIIVAMLVTIVVSYIVAKFFNIELSIGSIVVDFIKVCVPIVTYVIFSKLYSRCDFQIVLFNSMSFIIVIKFVSDMLFFGSYFSKFFLYSGIAIYNWSDYFPMMYVLAIALASNIIFQSYDNKKKIQGVLVMVVSIICVFNSHSFGAQYIVIALILSFAGYALLRMLHISVDIKIICAIAVSCFIIIVFVISRISHWNIFVGTAIVDPTLLVRYGFWHAFMDSLKGIQFLLPLLNEYRIQVHMGTGSMHNEVLQIYSNFGLVVIAYYHFWLRELVTFGGRNLYLVVGILLYIFMGGLLQSNTINPYLGVIFGLVCAAGKINSKGEKSCEAISTKF